MGEDTFLMNELACQELFGIRDELLLGVEGAYYSRAKKARLVAPARVLWYVSQGK